MPRADNPQRHSATIALLWGIAIVAALYFAREVLLPFALAVLFSFLVAPLIDRFEKWGFSRVPAVLTVVVAGFLALGTFGYVLFAQVYDLAYRLPEYETNLTNKAKILQGDGRGVLSHVVSAFDQVQKNLKREAQKNAAESQAADGTSSDADQPHEIPRDLVTRLPAGDPNATVTPIPVQIVESISPGAMLPGIVASLSRPLGTAMVVVIFVIFMLLEREDLRNRLIHLIGAQQLNFTTQALDDAAHRVSRYLRMQLIINSAFGGVAAVGLALIEVPNSPLWGICAGLLRFVPYAGPVVAALIPLALSLTIFDGWARPGLVALLFLIDELVAGNVLEPRFYASSTSISGLGVMVSSVFWLWLWGPVGLILAMPLTVCLVVMGSYVPRLNFLNTLLADRHVLSPASRYYQRLLASDPEEALEVAELYLNKNSIESLYDDVIVPALSLAENDRHHGNLADAKQELIYRTTRDLVEDLGTRQPVAPLKGEEEAVEQAAEKAGTATATSSSEGPVSVLCLPARDEADEIVALMLDQLLASRGVRARVLSVTSLASEMLAEVRETAPAVVCVSALPPFAGMHARYLCKRLAPAIGKVPIVAGLWQANGGTKKAEEKLSETGAARCVTTLTEAAEHIAKLAIAARVLRCA